MVARRLGTVAWARDLATLSERVRALAPGATVRLVVGPPKVRLAGRPVVGLARVDGSAVFLCRPLILR